MTAAYLHQCLITVRLLAVHAVTESTPTLFTCMQYAVVTQWSLCPAEGHFHGSAAL